MDPLQQRQRTGPEPARAEVLSTLPPAVVWLAAAAAALLRALPFLRVVAGSGPPGTVPLPAGYVLNDWLAYVALVRQGPGLLANPFTTEPQDGRIVLLLHQALAAVHRATGADPFWILELSRIPLVALLALAVWRFTGHILRSDRERVWASCLVLFSGGLGYLVLLALPMAPEPLRAAAGQDLWTAYGWSTFEAAYNPLWVAGLTLQFLALRPLLQPGGPRTLRDGAAASVAFLACWLVHPYSAVVVAAAALVPAASEWVSGDRAGWARLRNVGVALAPAALACGALLLWQRADPAFRAASGGFFGQQAATVFWYPVTLAAVGFFALRGLRTWAGERHPWRHGFAGWVAALVLLHASNVVNGYHFVFALHAPLAMLAAGPVSRWFSSGRGAPAAVARAAVALALFGSAIGTTALDAGAASAHYVARPLHDLLTELGRAPPGNVLAPAALGNVVPAYGRHRVFVGHWFMTPDYERRAARYEELVRDPGRAAELDALIRRERIRYLVLPAGSAGPALSALGVPVEAARQFGELVLVWLADG
jgi:hypothetical protein